ncbi:hypothetical protein Rhe02_15110 [Rhizocola hellebori]|uniref:Carrier domain-containing protein n=1 Tax=Rhizocola hellebori TaxID=1392758 RepID=A0A8J3VDC5_9ACTN|nr:non-ribosomal peptide synthetase [Rhizocola hellebori]GIH03444.1 hypothetical protein Rhe02_15110 [Rhizocola hellebori]
MPSAPSDSTQLDQLLRELGGLRVRLHADGGRLRCVGPAGVLTPELLGRVRRRRAELLRMLSANPDEPETGELSYAQERIWLHQRLDPEGSAYNIPLDVDLTGSLSAEALRHALSVVIARHEPLRTTFRATDGLEQTVLAPRPATFALIDLTGLPPAARAEAQRRVSEDFARRAFDQSTSPGIRQAVLRLGTESHQLMLPRHHLTSDGWSFGVLATDLGRAYTHAVSGHPVSLPPLRWRYRDFVRWQRTTAETGGFAAGLQRWEAHLAGSTFLSGGLGRWGPPGGDPAATIRLRLRGAISTAIHTAARHAATTPFTVLATAVGLAIAAVTGAPDAVIGVAVSGRTRPEIEPLVGSFATVLPLRVNARRDATVHETLLETHRTVTQVLKDQDVPLEHILRAVAPGRRWFGRPPPFAAVLTYQNTPGIEVSLPRLEALLRETAPVAPKFPLTLTVNHVGPDLELFAEYDARALDDAAVRQILLKIISILEGTENPIAQPQTSADTMPDVADDSTLAERFEAVAARQPHAIAVTDSSGQVSFRELRRRARRIASALLACGVEPGGRVAICMPHNAHLAAAIVGAGLAGAAYVPLDPDDPAARHESVMADAGVGALLTTERWGDRFAWLDRPVVTADRPPRRVRALPSRRSADQIAYVVYTSGSTGTPKGVLVSHRNVLGLLSSALQRFDFTEADTWSMTHSAAFDFSVWELWMPLLTGGRLVIVPREGVRDTDSLRSALEREQVTVHSSTPSAFDALVQSTSLSARTVVLGGERCDPARLGNWLDRVGPATQLVNMYGITETTVHVTHRVLTRMDAGGTVSPIGKALPGVRAAVTEAGEIVVGGWGVANGYLHRPALTAERFVPDELGPAGARAYRSGDLAAATADGELRYLGRLDAQVKVRGYRVEPGEVAAALRTHPRVGEAVVVPTKRALVAYFVAKPGQSAPTTQDLRHFLSQRLPSYLVPARYLQVDAFPLNRNGKLDLAALPAVPVEVGHEQPRTPTEQQVAKLWCELLGLATVGVHDDFFTLGGDSLLVTRLHARLQEAFGVDVPMRQVYDVPDMAALAGLIDALLAGQGEESP